MGKLGLTGLVGAAVAVLVLPTAHMPTAHAAPCPDAQVVFARGTTEKPGTGPTGDAFVASLRSLVGAKTLGVYGVDYPAAMDFATAIEGIADARAHVLDTVANCPNTKLVLSGFSQGAAVIGFVTASEVPEGVSPSDVPTPMPPEVADHVAAVALFGKPSTRFMKAIGDPSIVVGPRYLAKTVDVCLDNDLVCDPKGRGFSVHNRYAETGKVDEAAVFVANKLQASWDADAAATAAASVATQTPATPTPQSPSTPARAPLSGPVTDASPSVHLGSTTQSTPGPPPLPGPVPTAPQPAAPLA